MELSCGGEAPQRGSQSARDKSRPTVTVCYARIELPTAVSVSLSDLVRHAAPHLNRATVREKRELKQVVGENINPATPTAI